MEILLVAVLIGLIPAVIARSKGRSFGAWWLYGAALFIVALPHSLLMKPDQGRIEAEQLGSGSARKCPFCAEIIKMEALVCRFCGRDLPPAAPEAEILIPAGFKEMSDDELKDLLKAGSLESKWELRSRGYRIT